MVISELLILILFALIVIFLVIGLPIAMVFNMRQGLQYRENLALQLEKLRLNRMLQSLGIDINQYLSQQRVVDIRDHMERCQSCGNADECDSALSLGEASIENIDYCANNESLATISGSDDNKL